jgi:hypothetical protein
MVKKHKRGKRKRTPKGTKPKGTKPKGTKPPDYYPKRFNNQEEYKKWVAARYKEYWRQKGIKRVKKRRETKFNRGLAVMFWINRELKKIDDYAIEYPKPPPPIKRPIGRPPKPRPTTVVKKEFDWGHYLRAWTLRMRTRYGTKYDGILYTGEGEDE